ncbi:alpha-galactosidase [uncultured Nocardioides sp.]|uniref:alpha-galactosidase n=1 Tax=uncultured Nocardioides sp. TaxID=198441 RepID=UPI00263097D6|nr:alpha-galactosidase [uncultured Nocardioides sp.]
MSIVLAPSLAGDPILLHWGAELGGSAHDGLAEALVPAVPHSALDSPRQRGLLGQTAAGDTGLPGLEGLRPDGTPRVWAPRITDWRWSVDDTGADACVGFAGRDPEAGWSVDLEVRLTAEGLVLLRTFVTNDASSSLVLAAVRSALPVPARATELLDLTGRWCRERTPVRRPWLAGTHLREGRHGRTGHDATLLLAAGVPGFGFGHGEVWATHVAWSGDHAAYAERTPEGECVLGGGELLGPGEVVLGPGERYDSPWLVGAWSEAGLDHASARLHSWLRRRSPRTRKTRPVLVNTWEAVYMDHRLETLTELAEAAAEVGVERFVLDDGWFRARRTDRAGLGDWEVDPEVWPDGLHPLVERVHALGMDLGLWVEPEMVNDDSDLVRAHPEWVLRGRSAAAPQWRHQQVLDLQHPDAYAHVRGRLLALLGEYPIAFLKWDHNRDLVDVAHQGRPAVHGQTVAFYRLLDELREAHPDLEIETCASGGGRIDLEVLTRTDRVWPSDTIDAVERQRINRWTSLLVPPEMLGAHIGGPVAHTTGRTLTTGFRAATALFGHLGIEWDLRAASAEERAEVAAWVALHKQLRPLLLTGRLVRGDHHDPAVVVSGIVAADRTEAWYVVATVDSPLSQAVGAVRLPGLDPAASYHVVDRTPPGARHRAYLGEHWLDGSDGVVVGGRALGEVGVGFPPLGPEVAHVLHVTAP